MSRLSVISDPLYVQISIQLTVILIVSLAGRISVTITRVQEEERVLVVW